MILHLSLAAAPGLPPAAAAWVCAHAELVVDTERGGSPALAAWLRAQLAAAGGTGPAGSAALRAAEPVPLAVAGRLLDTLEPGTAPLLDGAVIVCGDAGPGTAAEPRRTMRPLLALAVSGGPDAGRVFELRRGRHVLGRRNHGLGVDDPAPSRRHAVLEVTGPAVLLRDAGSANGLYVGGRRTSEADLASGTTIAAGNSRLRLVPGHEALPPYVPEAELAEPVPVRARPPRSGGRAALLAAGLPALAGLVLAVATGMWFFLAFGAMSLAAAAIPYTAGRKQRRAYRAAVAEAAAADGERRRCAAPDPARLLFGLLEPADTAESGPGPPRHLWLRLGVADQPAAVGPSDGAGGPEPPTIADAPVLVDLLEVRELAVRGTGRELEGMLRCCLLQLGRRALDCDLQVVCCGGPDGVPAPARFIPGVRLAGHGPLPAAVPAGGSTVLLLSGAAADLPVPPGPATAVIRFRAPGPPAPESGPPAPAVLTLGPGPARLEAGRQRLEFAADLVGQDTLDRFARLAAAAGRRRRQGRRELPVRYPLGPVLAGLDIGAGWRRNRNRRGLASVVGCTAGGPLELDLAADGPHLLIAGTTGSGKSELLRGLVLGIAAAYPPQQARFLLVDFKGGAGLAVLAGLPHTAGLLTDLSVENVGRALRWLGAEVRRREQVLASLGARDIADCAAGALPRLVVVIDEFRMLVDDLPEALREPLRIAAVGWSLGIHLVMATQRPQGAVSPDIRANINAVIALRVLSELESGDLLGTPAAARIGARTPGRAYLRLAGSDPVPFQSACLEDGPRPAPAVQTLTRWLAGQAGDTRAAPQAGHGAPGPDWTAGVVAQVRRAAAAHPPAASGPALPPPLPLLLEPAALAGPDAGPPGIGFGLLDLPEEQRQVPLRWLPEHHGHLCLAGSETSGAPEVLQWLGAALLADGTERHCYLLDGDGTLGRLAGAGRIGAYAGPGQAEHGARVLRRLAREAAERLAAAACVPQAAGTQACGAAARVPLVLLISGWGRWASSFRSGRLAWAEECLNDIARDGGTARISLAMSGDRELAGGRFFALVPNRCFLPSGSTAEARLAWPRLPAMDPLPGRALVQGPVGGAHDAVAQLVAAARLVPDPVPPARRPFRVEPLPVLVPASELPAAGGAPDTGAAPVVGVEGAGLRPSVLPLRPGAAYLVLGGAGSGKSNLLDVLAGRLGRCVRRPGPGCLPDGYWEQLPGTRAGEVLLVDDAPRLGPAAQRRLGGLAAGGAAVVLTAVPGAALLQWGPLAAQARASGWGLVLAPRFAADADFFGLRLDAEGAPPGRGYRIEHGRATPVQIALKP
ncbi:FHA domain-containing protein [Arthrobacter deserti]|uniref:FHA domain-containing protein n=1 Tax=Arthrobacter deserti TaxID=1742687 RepID=A0ABX1JNW4_9MICC|nr:FHA domain-containing protein [Arthrobacter deserti]